MPDEKLNFLRQSHILHPHPERVRDPLFTSGSPFFDARDLVQVKYELLRRVRVDGYSVSDATALFALSRPTFYAALSAWEQAGISGLLPVKTGPRRAHKLTDEIMRDLLPLSKTMSAAELASWLEAHRNLIVHPRSIERALKRAAKKGGPHHETFLDGTSLRSSPNVGLATDLSPTSRLGSDCASGHCQSCRTGAASPADHTLT